MGTRKKSTIPGTTDEERLQCNAIFSARTRMLNINGNYHNRNTDPTCRACGNKTKTQKHILEECQLSWTTKMKK